MKDWVKFSYISRLKHGIDFKVYDIELKKLTLKYNYLTVYEVVKKMRYNKNKYFLGSKAIIKEIDKYLVK